MEPSGGNQWQPVATSGKRSEPKNPESKPKLLPLVATGCRLERMVKVALFPLGSGARPSVASLGDLPRMLAACGRDDDLARLHSLRRLSELDQSRGLSL